MVRVDRDIETAEVISLESKAGRNRGSILQKLRTEILDSVVRVTEANRPPTRKQLDIIVIQYAWILSSCAMVYFSERWYLLHIYHNERLEFDLC